MTFDPHDDELQLPATTTEAAATRLLDEQAPAEEFAALNAAERRRVVDWQWLHSLLMQVLHRDAVARERRITRACLAIRDDAARQLQPASTLSAPRHARWLVPFTVAAALVVCAALFRGNLNPQPSAMAAVQTTLKEAQSSSDRFYKVTTVYQNLGGETRELSADLWVQGSSRFVLRQETPLGELRLGSDGDQHWLVPSLGAVRVGDDAGFFEQLLLGRPVATPYLQVTSLLERMSDHYDLSLAPEEELTAVDSQGTVRCTHVIGRKQGTEAPLAPDVIELWTARQSGTAFRIVARWTVPLDGPGPREVQLQWAPLNEPLASDWYEHAAHHPPDRRIIRRGGGASGEL